MFTTEAAPVNGVLLKT
uniref:Uncharacterized protein n=1 Tax=Anguilla anguilla TaxID=7936 RepID=A0A0E9SQA6_ANGAN